jgi:Fic family protein
MTWIWQLQNWPNFEYDSSLFTNVEQQFIQNNGILIGAIKHFSENNTEQLKIEILTQEAIATSIIEGEIVQHYSVQSSIKKHLGLQTDKRKIQLNENGIAELMVDVYKNFNTPLTHTTLYKWHKMICNGRRDVEQIGAYRKHEDAMQIVTGNLGNQKLLYEAPPSNSIKNEMQLFINWYNKSIMNKGMPTIVIAGLVHLYFECIHPFEDGNGRIGRALVEKIISQKLGFPALHSLSKIIETNKKEYYAALQSSNHNLNCNKWLYYFSNTIIQAQLYTVNMVDFIIAKAKFFTKFSNTLNVRQEKVVLRIFDAGLEGFKGGLSAANYKSITGTSAATATRDLQELVTTKAIVKTGQLKHTRYSLNLINL